MLLLESLEETLDIVWDNQLMESLRRSRDEAARGERFRLKDQVWDPEYEVEITPEVSST